MSKRNSSARSGNMSIDTALDDSETDTTSQGLVLSSPVKNPRATSPSPSRKGDVEQIKQRAPSLFGFGKKTTDSNNLYLTKEEEVEIQERLKIRNSSIMYVYEYIYYGVPVKTKGMNQPGSPTKELGGNGAGREVMTNDPDLTVMSIDGNMVLKQRVQGSGMGGKEAHRQSINLGVEFASYPESVCVDRYGDIFVSMKDSKKGKRKIDGVAQMNLKFVPEAPEPPFCVGVTSNSVTIGWKANDEGTGLVDRYNLEYRELNENNSGYRALATINWARDDDLLYVLENVRPNNSFTFRVKSRNRLGWSEMSKDSAIVTTDADAPDTPSKCFSTKVTKDSINLHWHPPNDNGSRIIKYIVRGKKVGCVFLTIYEGSMTGYMVCDVEGGCDYVYEVMAVNSCGKSNWSPSYTCQVPLIQPARNDNLEMNPDLRRGHLWIECWDQKDERVFYFHTITNQRSLVPPPEYIAYRQESEMKSRGGGGAGGEKKEEELDPVKAFRVKRYKFFQNVRKRSGGGKGEGQLHNLTIRRNNLFTDTFNKFSHFGKADLIKKFKIIFQGEEGIDSGGLTKDWYLGLSRAFGVEKLKIFQECSGGGFEIHQKSGAGVTQLQKFRFAGMVLGKALYDRQFLDMPLSKCMYKMILGLDVGVGDLEEVDKGLMKSLAWMAENSIDGVLFETFSVQMDGGGRVALCEDGENRDVTDENKDEYVRLMSEWRVKWSVASQLESFMEGLNTLVPKDLLQGFTVSELELLFNGKKHIDVDEIRAYTIYQGDIKPDSKICTWLWQCLREVSTEKKMLLLKFITGSDRVPLDGYNPPFNITFGSDMGEDDLPRAHTCFNQIVIPGYKNYRTLKEKCLYAAENCDEFVLT